MNVFASFVPLTFRVKRLKCVVNAPAVLTDNATSMKRERERLDFIIMVSLCSVKEKWFDRSFRFHFCDRAERAFSVPALAHRMPRRRHARALAWARAPRQIFVLSASAQPLSISTSSQQFHSPSKLYTVSLTMEEAPPAVAATSPSSVVEATTQEASKAPLQEEMKEDDATTKQQDDETPSPEKEDDAEEDAADNKAAAVLSRPVKRARTAYFLFAEDRRKEVQLQVGLRVYLGWFRCLLVDL
jgi:hypothetical protein